MIEKVIKNAHLRLKFRKDMEILFLRWSDRVQGDLLRQGYLGALDFAKEVGANFWMYDLRGRGAALPEDEEWILEEFFKKAEATLQGPQYFSYLLSPNHFAHIQNEVGLDRLSSYGNHTQIKVFMSESEAINWLLEMKGLPVGVHKEA